MMLNAFRVQLSNPRKNNLPCKCNGAVSFSSHHRFILRLPNRLNFASFTLHSVLDNASSDPSEDSSQLTSTIGSSSISYQPLTHRHIQILSFIACTAAISATWLFCSAIPTLLAFKRAAESLEKLMDVTREELPDTMAAVRLSGMEISDLTMELSDLGQEITQGVRSSTRAVRLAEERLRRLTNMSPTVSVQEAAPTGTGIARPVVAEAARGLRDRIVKGRSALQVFFTFTRFSKMFFNYFTSRAKA